MRRATSHSTTGPVAASEDINLGEETVKMDYHLLEDSHVKNELLVETLKLLELEEGKNDDTPRKPKKDELAWIKSIEGIVFLSYLSNIMALSLPLLLVPIAAAEHVGGHDTMMIASVVAGISSIATMGGAFGKFTNGFICQHMGAYKCSEWYFYGLAACEFMLSLTSSSRAVGLACAGMEFFASVQWAALAVMLSNYYEKQPVRQAAALTVLGLSSTSGQIAAKTIGMTLVSTLHWRVVAQIGAVIAFLGGILISKAPRPAKENSAEPVNLNTVKAAVKAVLGNPLFWMLATAHGLSYVARGTERFLSTFFEHMVPGMTQGVSGGLTMCITIGLASGLMSGSKIFTTLPSVSCKKKFLAKRYFTTVAATVGLTLAAQFGSRWVQSKFVMTGAIALLSGAMVSNISFQYYQFPAMIGTSKLFSDHKAVAISFLDGFGFLLATPIFAITSEVIPTQGWPAAWALLAGLFCASGILMLCSIGPILKGAEESHSLKAPSS